MRKDDILETLNIGIPFYEGLDLPIATLTNNYSENESKAITKEREIFAESTERLNKVIGNNKINNNSPLLKKVGIYAETKNANTIIGIDNKQTLINLFEDIASLDRINNEQDMLLNIKKEIKELEKILTDFIYKEHRNIKKYFEEEKKYLEILQKNHPVFLDLYRNNKSNKTIWYFLELEFDYYEKILNNIKNIQKIDNNDLINDYFEMLNVKKTSLFIVCEHLINAIDYINKNDFYNARKYMFLVNAYLDKKSNNDGTQIYYHNKVVDYNYLMDLYNYILNNYPLIKRDLLNRKLFLGNGKKENEKVIDSLLNLNIVDTNKTFIKKGELPNININTQGEHEILPVTEKELRQIEEEIEKRRFIYLKNEPIALIETDNVFPKYDAYVYNNGMVLADRFHKINRLKQLKESAMYVFDAENFEHDIKLTKQDLIGKVPRHYHTDNWPQRVDKLANKETNKELKEKAKVLSKKKKI